MKKIDLFVLCSLLLIISVSFLSLKNNEAAGQTSSSSSSSGGSTSTTLSDGFTGTWHATVDKTVSVNGVPISSVSREITLKLCVNNGRLNGFIAQPGIFRRAAITSQNVTSSSNIVVQLQDRNGRTSSLTLTLNNGKLGGTFSNGISFVAERNEFNPRGACIGLGILPGGGSTSSSGGSTTVGLSENFTGVWQARLDATVTVNGVQVSSDSRIITLRLCLQNGKLTGVIRQPHIFRRAVITSQSVNSPNDVVLQLQDVTGRTSSLTLSLSGDELNGTFSNGVSFVAIKRNKSNPRGACIGFGIAPTSGEGNTGGQ